MAAVDSDAGCYRLRFLDSAVREVELRVLAPIEPPLLSQIDIMIDQINSMVFVLNKYVYLNYPKEICNI